MVRTLLNPFTFVDPKRESRESEPDHSELPDRVPEETELKVKRRRLSAPRGVGRREGGGVSEEDIFYLSATNTAAAVADVAPACFSRYHFLFFFNSGASVIHTSCFSPITFFSILLGLLRPRLPAELPRLLDSPASPEDGEQDDEDGRARGHSHHGCHP